MRYFFSIRDNEKFIEDREGAELPNLAAAIAECRLAIREMIANMVRKGEPIDGQVFEISDSMGNILATLPWRKEIKFDD